jgi:hypothetical protein
VVTEPHILLKLCTPTSIKLCHQVHAAVSECHEDPATGTYNCEELAEAVAGMVMALG